MAGRCLIVANQTLGGEALEISVQDCISRDVRQFYVVVPMTQVRHETPAWTAGFGIGKGALMSDWMPDQGAAPVGEKARRREEADVRRREGEAAEARRRAQDRLDLMIAKIHSMGGEAEGSIEAEDPVDAARSVLEEQPPFEEIIVSTLPSRLSRWVKMDLPSRIARITDTPVTTVEAEG